MVSMSYGPGIVTPDDWDTETGEVWYRDSVPQDPRNITGTGTSGNAATSANGRTAERSSFLPPGVEERGTPPLYADVAALLDGGLPDPPAPEVLRRNDGVALFYSGQVNYLFGDPESGKSLVAQAAVTEVLRAGGRALFVDMDHNGLQSTVCRLIDMGSPESALRSQETFRYVEPEDMGHLLSVVKNAKDWKPTVAVVDSIGELLPLLRLSSNSPDDFTVANARVLKPLATAGAAVIAIDHLPKNAETRANGPTGTAAKRRSIGGVSIRVTADKDSQFVPGRGGACWLNVNKDRHGGLRRHCPSGEREPLAGQFSIDPGDDMVWRLRAAQAGDQVKALGVATEDLDELEALDPPPKSVRDVKNRLNWSTNRAMEALRAWKDRSRNVPEERGTDGESERSSFLNTGSGEQGTLEGIAS